MEDEILDTFEYKSTTIALYLIARANNAKYSINITKVQKLLYIVYGTYLRVYGERLLNEHPQAWPYGPVFPTTRSKLLKKGDFSSITMQDVPDIESLRNDIRLNKVIDFAFRNFGTWNAGQLSEWSHSAGSPWEQTTTQVGFRWGDTIPDRLIRDYFKSIVIVKQKE